MLDDFVNAYAGVSAPDKRIGQERKPAQENSGLIPQLFVEWAHYVEHHAPAVQMKGTFHSGLTGIADNLLAHAVRLLDDIVPPTVIDNISSFPFFLLPEAHRDWAGIFYTALLNKGTYKVIVPEIVGGQCWGYRLARGFLTLHNMTGHVGCYEEGGCIVNKGQTWVMGFGTFGGVSINDNSCRFWGGETRHGLFINRGHVEKLMLYDQVCHINLGRVTTIRYLPYGTPIEQQPPSGHFFCKQRSPLNVVILPLTPFQKESLNKILAAADSVDDSLWTLAAAFCI